MEILQNTIIKLITRQGTDLDRKSTLLNSGEFGYANDTERLWIGDGYTSGGKIVGNKYAGTAPDITTLSPSEIGDIAFSNDTNFIYRLKEGDGSALSGWEKIGGLYSSSDPYITIDADNSFVLNPLSAYALSNDATMLPITLSGGRIALSPLSSNYISSDAVTSPLYISSGRIALSSVPFGSVSTTTMVFSGGLVASVNGSDVTGVPINPLSANLVIQSNQLYSMYNGVSASEVFSKNISSVTKLSAGHYTFNYFSLPTSNIIPNVQLYGNDTFNLDVRTIYISNSACTVRVLSSGVGVDATVTLLLSY